MSELDVSKYIDNQDLENNIPGLKEHYKEIGDKYNRVNKSVRELYKYQQDCFSEVQKFIANYNLITKEIEKLSVSHSKLQEELDYYSSISNFMFNKKELTTIPKEELERLKEIEENYKLSLTKEN